MLFGKFDIHLKAKIHSKKMLHTTGLESLLCALTPWPAWRFSFALVCPPVSISCAFSFFCLQDKRFLFVFCLRRTSENGIPVQSEEEPSVLPRLWVTLELGDAVVPERYKNSPSGNAKFAKVTQIQLQI